MCYIKGWQRRLPAFFMYVTSHRFFIASLVATLVSKFLFYGIGLKSKDRNRVHAECTEAFKYRVEIQEKQCSAIKAIAVAANKK